jgi:hypothetical protein
VTLTMDEEKRKVPEATAIEINEIKSDYFEKEADMKSDFVQPHNGRKIDEIIVSRYIDDDPYVVTYSEEDNSIQGWSVDFGGNGRQKLDVSYNFYQQHGIKLYKLYKLYNKILLFSYYDDSYRK